MKDADIKNMAEAFLRWPLPDSVRADDCACRQGSGRIGTNLLSYPEAVQMIKEVVAPNLPHDGEPSMRTFHDAAMRELYRMLDIKDDELRFKWAALELGRRLDRLKNLEEELARVREEVIWVFEENLVPEYIQGYTKGAHEITRICTAAEVQGMVARLAQLITGLEQLRSLNRGEFGEVSDAGIEAKLDELRVPQPAKDPDDPHIH